LASPGEWVLAIDFGTTNTVAAVKDARGTSTLMVDGRPVTPSAVFLHPNTRTWSVGETAIRQTRRRLEWFEPNPKRSVPDGVLFLGGQTIPVGEAITAVFRPIIEEAASQHGGRSPAAFVVTHPANWGEARVTVLVKAATDATGPGWPKPLPLSEPVAAAQAILGMDDIPKQARLVVLDLGGGTVDAAVADRDGDTLTVVGSPQGRDGMGGEDYDQRLARWMVAEVGAAGLYDRLATSDDPEERELAVEIRANARSIKEQLSRQAAVPAQLPKSPPELPEITPVMVTRPQLEELICGGPSHEPGLAESVEIAYDVLSRSPPGPPFVGVFLTGGCARIPMLGTVVQERTGLPPLTYGDPTTAVAHGAAHLAWKGSDLGEIVQEGAPGTSVATALLAGATADTIPEPGDGRVWRADRLGTSGEVEMLVSVLLASDAQLPLAVGLFGDWGSGKSFFMALMQERIDELAKEAAEDQSEEASPFCHQVCQVRFNAWHYVDTSLWASLAATLFDTLARGDTADAAEIKVTQLDEARKEAARAEAERQRLEHQVTELAARIERPGSAMRASVSFTIRAVRADPELLTKLSDLAHGGTTADNSTERLVNVLGELDSLGTKTRAFWRLLREEVLYRRRWTTLVSVAVLAGLGIIASIVASWPAGAKIAAFIGAVAAGLVPALSGAARLLYLAREARVARELPLMEKRDELTRAQIAEKDAAREVAERERELAELRDRGLQLRAFVRERAASSDYRAS
jgi:actin-like ATPase involved in cell morphogenesis